MKFIYYSICLATLFSISTAVSNGSFVSIKEYPYYVSITSANELNNICGASIISDTWIITAAHCIVDFSLETKVRSGSSTDGSVGLLHDIEKVIVHRDYVYISRDIPADNDIALIKIKNPLQFTEMQIPIKIRSEPVQLGDTVVVVGLGLQGIGMHTPALKSATLTVAENHTCDPLMASTDHIKLGYHGNSFCAGGNGTDACSGDSGGPVVLDNELVGLVSYGPDCDGHVRPNESGSYTVVHQYRDWVYKHTGIR